jgi:hypothetical protein
VKASIKYLLFGLLITALLPYFILCFYALPFADDFCFGWITSQDIPFLQKFLNQYLKWNGRFTSDVLVNIHPLATGRMIVYQLSLFASLLVTPVAVFIFLQQVIRDKAKAFLASLFITLFYLAYLPNLTEGVYWYIGVVNYHLGNLCLLLQLSLFLFLFQSQRRNIFLEIANCILLVISIGFNEIGAILIPMGYAVITLSFSKSSVAGFKLARIHFVVAIIASAFVFFSPGNQIRAEEFSERYQLFHSLSYSFLQTVRFISMWSLNYPFIVLSLLIAANADKVRIDFQQKIDYRLPLLALLVCVFTASFLPYFATGSLGQHRTLNYTLLFFVLLWLMFVVSSSQQFKLYENLNFLRSDFARDVMLTSSVLVIFFSKTITPVNDLFSLKFDSYKTEFLARQENIVNHPEQKIAPLATKPSSFTIVDAKGNSSFFADKCMKRFYEETRIKLR